MSSPLQVKQLTTMHIGPIDLNVNSNECVCLSGPSGTGKSILLRAMVDLIPHEGEIMLGDEACSQTRPCQWRHRVGLLPAESQWWYERVGDHFVMPVPETWLTQLGFTKEVMDWQVARCSTGEKQRLALLRLLVNEPQALLLDEPTASLDADSIQRVEQLIADYRQQHQAPVLWVSHDPGQITRVANRHYTFQEGVLEEVAL